MAPGMAILDAAYDILVAHGWAAARMADVAARAGVSRQTVYNEFGSKEGLARAVLLREAGRFLDGIASLLDEHVGEPDRAVEAAVLFTLTAAADNPLLKAVLTASGDEDLLPLLTTRSEWLLVAARSVLGESLARRRPDLSTEDVAVAADAAVRLTVSHLVLPSEPADVSARRLARLIGGYLRRPSAGDDLDRRVSGSVVSEQPGPSTDQPTRSPERRTGRPLHQAAAHQPEKRSEEQP